MNETKNTSVESKHLHVVEITETLNRLVVVEAKTEAEAIEKIEEQYHSEDIILDCNDHVDTKIEIYKYNDKSEIEHLIIDYIEEHREFDLEKGKLVFVIDNEPATKLIPISDFY